MGRKATIVKEDILESAFEIGRVEGFEQVTARRLAAKAGCSTQPIFRLYSGMEDLLAEVYEKAILYFEDFYLGFPEKSEVPFVNLGIAYIQFAAAEGNIFRLLFLSKRQSEKSMYELLNGKTGMIGKEITKAKDDGCKSPSELFMKMWIFIHGAACMSLTGDYDLNEDETIKLLQDSYTAYVKAME